MNESEFNQRVDDLLMQIEDAIDESGADIDYETGGGILTLSFTDGSKIIINRQTPLKQLWLAAKSGGFHFDYDAGQDRWLSDQDGEEFFSALNRYCSEQAGESVKLA